MTHPYIDTTLIIIYNETIYFYQRLLSMVASMLHTHVHMLTTAILFIDLGFL